MDSVLNTRHELFAQWEKQVDSIVIYLKMLQDANIPILWRPYHEMNGIWFWWGRRGQSFKQLWRNLYERLHHHKLNNLIWVWNANAPRNTPGDEAEPYEIYYPGHDYVDILATDIYHNDYKQSHYQDLLDVAEGELLH